MILQKAISLKWLAKSIHGKGVSWLDILERWMLRSIALFLSFANNIQEGEYHSFMVMGLLSQVFDSLRGIVHHRSFGKPLSLGSRLPLLWA